MEPEGFDQRRLAYSRRAREPDSQRAPRSGMQLLKEGQSQWHVVSAHRLDEGDGFGERTTVPSADTLCELVWK